MHDRQQDRQQRDGKDDCFQRGDKNPNIRLFIVVFSIDRSELRRHRSGLAALAHDYHRERFKLAWGEVRGKKARFVKISGESSTRLSTRGTLLESCKEPKILVCGMYVVCNSDVFICSLYCTVCAEKPMTNLNVREQGVR